MDALRSAVKTERVRISATLKSQTPLKNAPHESTTQKARLACTHILFTTYTLP